jgi:hypothetical protein
MGFSLYNLFKAGLLVTNGLVVLHPQRFLAKIGYDQPSINGDSLHNQIVGLLQAVSYLKAPLIVCNALVITVEILAGG